MGLFKRPENKGIPKQKEAYSFKLISDRGDGFYAYNGVLYQSDIIVSCVTPHVNAVGKLMVKHIRETTKKEGKKEISINPDAYMRILLNEPNEYMTMQKFLERMDTQLQLNNNAFAAIIRDGNGYPTHMYPIPATSATVLYDNNGIMFMRFSLSKGRQLTLPYTDIVHWQQCMMTDNIFGASPAKTLLPLMEIVTTADQGIVKAIKNGSIVQWLVKYSNSLRPEDIKANAKQFVDDYLSISSETIGVAATDAKADIQRVEPKDYVPNALQMDKTRQRIMSFYGTNDKIVTSSYTEDEWTAYYESRIEPVVITVGGQFTVKLFTAKERAYGNRIVADAANLASASLTTKLALKDMVDRGAMLPNEWRGWMNLPPLPGGDEPIRRLDTPTVDSQTEQVETKK